MEYHHGDYDTYGASIYSYFGKKDYEANKAKGRTDQEIKDWLHANPDKWAKGPKNRAGGGDWYDELEANIAAGAGGNKDYGFTSGGGNNYGVKPVEKPSIKNPAAGMGKISPNDFASDYMKKIMNARNNGQDPLRYDRELSDQNDTGIDIQKAINRDDNSAYDANRYKNTEFEYDKNAIKYKSPQYTG